MLRSHTRNQDEGSRKGRQAQCRIEYKRAVGAHQAGRFWGAVPRRLTQGMEEGTLIRSDSLGDWLPRICVNACCWNREAQEQMWEIRVELRAVYHVKLCQRWCSGKTGVEGGPRRPDSEKGMRCQIYLSFHPGKSKACKNFKLLQNKLQFIIGILPF